MGTFSFKVLHRRMGRNRPLVTIEPVEVQDFGKITHHFLSSPWNTILQTHIEKNRKITTCDWLDLETLGF